MIWYFKSNQKQIAENRKEETERESTYLAPTCAACCRSRPSPPLQPSVVFLPSPRSSCVLARARPRGHLLLADEPLDVWTTPAGRPDPTDRFAHSPPSTLPPLLPISRPDRTEPPPPPRLTDAPGSSASIPSSSPPSQAPREALHRLHAIVFVLDRRRWSPSIRRRSCFPELADPPCMIPVSPCFVSP